MGEEQTERLGFWSEHRYLLMILSSISISIVLVLLSMYVYFASGAAQLDLSRPGYQSVTDQIDGTKDFETYSQFGSLDSDSIAEFEKTFDSQVKKVTAEPAFGGDPLNTENLQISAQ